MSTKHLTAIITFAYAICLISCSKSGSDESQNIPAEGIKKAKFAEQRDSINPYNRINIKDLYTVTLPSYMVHSTHLNSEASLAYMSVERELYTIVFEELTDNIIYTYNEAGIKSTRESALKQYAEDRVSSFSSFAQVKEIGQAEQKTINALPAITIDIFARPNHLKHDVVYKLAFYQGREHIYWLMGWVIADRVEEYKSTLQDIIDSFRELEKSTIHF